MEDRLTELEVKVAFQEKLLGEIDDATRQLSTEFDVLRREVARLRQVLESIYREPRPLANEKPPHF